VKRSCRRGKYVGQA